jgi:hypothetical protein
VRGATVEANDGGEEAGVPIAPPQWWKHPRWCKRQFWKWERRNARVEAHAGTTGYTAAEAHDR